MNICIFLGNITHDLELRTVGAKGTQVLNFSIAVNRSYKQANGDTVKEVDYFNVEAWDSGATTIHRHFKKGDPIILHCSAKNDKYEDKEGKKQVKTKFRVDRFEFVPNRRKSEDTPRVDNNDDNDDGNDDSNDPIPF